MANSGSSVKSIDLIVSKYFKCLWPTRPCRDERIHNISYVILVCFSVFDATYYVTDFALDTIVIPVSMMAPVGLAKEAEEPNGFSVQQIDRTTAAEPYSNHL